MKTSEEYYKLIWKYRKRRQEAKVKWGLKSNKYRVVSANLTYKINWWNYKLKIAKKREGSMRNTLMNLDAKVVEFGGFSPRSPQIRMEEVKEARKLFFKWGLENGINSKKLGQYMGFRDRNSAATNRRSFTKSFASNSYNLDLWRRFRKFMRRDENYSTGSVRL